MTKAEQQELLKELGEVKERFAEIAHRLTHDEVEIPLIEQVWTYRWLGAAWSIDCNGVQRAVTAYDEMRDILLGIPALAKAGKDVLGIIQLCNRNYISDTQALLYLTKTLPNLQATADLRDALKAMMELPAWLEVRE